MSVRDELNNKFQLSGTSSGNRKIANPVRQVRFTRYLAVTVVSICVSDMATYYLIFCGFCITALKELNVIVDEPYMVCSTSLRLSTRS